MVRPSGSKTMKKSSVKKDDVVPKTRSKPGIVLDILTESDEETVVEKPVKTKKDTKSKPESDDFEKKYNSLVKMLKENYSQQKKIQNELKELMSSHKKEIKLVQKAGNRAASNAQKGFNKPEPVPASLKKLLGVEEDMLSRSKVTKLLYKYFTDNDMYNEKTKKEIIPNRKIREIFGMEKDEVITFYSFQTLLKKVYNENVLKEEQ